MCVYVQTPNIYDVISLWNAQNHMDGNSLAAWLLKVLELCRRLVTPIWTNLNQLGFLILGNDTPCRKPIHNKRAVWRHWIWPINLYKLIAEVRLLTSQWRTSVDLGVVRTGFGVDWIKRGQEDYLSVETTYIPSILTELGQRILNWHLETSVKILGESLSPLTIRKSMKLNETALFLN